MGITPGLPARDTDVLPHDQEIAEHAVGHSLGDLPEPPLA